MRVVVVVLVRPSEDVLVEHKLNLREESCCCCGMAEHLHFHLLYIVDEQNEAEEKWSKAAAAPGW